MGADTTFYSKVVVVTEKGEFPFENAMVAIAQPGLFVIGNQKNEQLGMFPIGAVVGILYPEGEMRVIGL